MNASFLSLLVPLTLGFHPVMKPAVPVAGCAPGAACVTGACPTPMGPASPMYPNWQVPCPPLGPPAPLLAMKMVTPAGVRMTAQPGTSQAQMFAAPTVLGMRPGYIYRLEISGIPGRPDTSLYPEIEVRGSLVPRPGMNYMEYPAAIVLTEADLERAASGTLITKMIYLEDPTRAAAIGTTVDKPLELISATEDDALRSIQEDGRLVAVVRVGNRVPSPEEMAQGTAGGMLFPGQAKLGPPSANPCLQAWGVPLYDPLLGPKSSSEECFTDGGDTGPRLGIGPNNTVGGLNTTDVAAEYSMKGVKRVTTSNQVCICVPRFAVRRVDLGIYAFQHAVRVEAGVQRFQTGKLVDRRHLAAMDGRIRPIISDSSIRLAAHVGTQQPITMGGLTGPAKAFAVVQGLRVVVNSVEVDEITNAEGFVVTKEVSPKSGVKIGDEVTFTLRFSNNTREPITDIVLSDSLSPRLEYIKGSHASDRPVNVSTDKNESGSEIVRFEVPGTLQPGQSGMVRFRAKVR